jgi:hypothetical protein
LYLYKKNKQWLNLPDAYNKKSKTNKKICGKDFTLKKSLSGVSLWAWGLGTPSHICKQMMKTVKHTENKWSGISRTRTIKK